MKKTVLLFHLVFTLLSARGQGVVTNEKLSVEARMAKARAAKTERKIAKPANAPGDNKLQKARSADYQPPVNKVLKGPNGEVVRTGERGAKYYVNKNGSRTYLSSNQ
ncbi:hypothetical protein [Spirosoma utsteinense]|uniref:PBCV-specific basic adaptor domain-containing protein n=1 Tax=Spirosoma utsteinense TaxID=2585773 RepID=A0ABR6W897_9BACT|nr:hypothetical protein [Spirosoma utsteinense]MBC3784174.1 hypothetical protein [Spirosoma utsteinense]MBC3792737.1 hypothetical protein [Spirosoma utsteinense]